MANPKVVPLQPARKAAAATPPIVNSVRQQARKQLLALVRDLLNGTDDALFEMADRSHSNTDHNLYFDSMRQIRLQRANIEKVFADELVGGFDRAFAQGSGAADSLDGIDAEDMTLVQSDELEISVAISGIVSKITSQFSLPIMELTKRLDHLAKDATISERRNPLGPQMVSEAFGRAIEGIDLDIRIRIILLKLFERMVMQRMGPVYEAANRILLEAGVLKDLRRSLGRGRNGGAPPRQPPRTPSADGDRRGGSVARAGVNAGGAYGSGSATGSGQTGPGDGSAEGAFGVIQGLLAAMRGQEAAEPPHGSAIATPELIDVLSAVQTEAGHQRLSVEELPPRLDLRQVLVARARDVTGEAISHLGRADEDVVNFIGLLFDYILNDRNLAIPMKALIARLQIPIVKLAIIDKSFFDRSSHPARQLLNELSSAGIGWSSAAELKRDAVYDKIESIVVRVLNDFSDNPDIFAELLDELRSFRAQDTVRNARIEQRVKEKESGKARTLAARQEVQQVINQKACGLRLPRELGRFLSDVWSRALVYVSLREGADSTSWESLMLTLDDLLWSLQPLDDLDRIREREALRDDLLQRVRDGMELIQLPDADQNQWCDVIAGQIDEVTRNDRAFLEDDDFDRAPDVFPEMDEIVLAAPESLVDSYQGEPPAPAFVDRINDLAEGSWVELRQAGEEVLRCKLAAIVRPGDRYVFVNRRGMKVAEKTRMQLARELQDDQVVMLNDAEVFDRALQAVIGNLRQVQKRS